MDRLNPLKIRGRFSQINISTSICGYINVLIPWKFGEDFHPLVYVLNKYANCGTGLNPLKIRGRFSRKQVELPKNLTGKRLNPLKIRGRFSPYGIEYDATELVDRLNPLKIRGRFSQINISTSICGYINVLIPWKFGEDFHPLVYVLNKYANCGTGLNPLKIRGRFSQWTRKWPLWDHPIGLNPLKIRGRFSRNILPRNFGKKNGWRLNPLKIRGRFSRILLLQLLWTFRMS